MRRLSLSPHTPVRLLALLAGVAGACVLAGVAHAYWTSSGVGIGNAGTGTISAPTNVVATASTDSATVPVSWDPTAGPNGGAVDGYYVQRWVGSTASAACSSSPAVLLPAATTTCSDAGVPNGTYSYSVTAVVGSWTAQSIPSAATSVSLVNLLLTAPTTVIAGSPFTVTVTARDGAGVQVSGYTGTVHFQSADPGSPVLPSDYTFLPGDGGTATFTNGIELHTGPSQDVTVTDLDYPSRTSSVPIGVTPGTATAVGFITDPGGGSSSVVWATQPKVAIQDVYGNTVTTSTAGVTLTIASGTSGAVLTCTSNPKAAVAGVATFAGCKIDKSGSYVLTGTSGALTSATSASFNVVAGPATKLVYTAQPTSVIAGASISPAVTVAVQDAGGNTVTSSGATVALAFGANPGGGTLSGTASAVVSGGVATFSNLSINKSANSYTLSATSTGLTSATSSTFNVAAATASQVGFTVQPGGGTGGVAWATQPKVAIQDVYGNTVTTSTAGVTLTIASGTSGAVLTCTSNPKAAVAGVATFAGCKIDKSGSYVLTGTSGALTSATSASFNVVVGPATKLVYTAQPTSVIAGASISPAVTVAVQDAGGNTVTSSGATVALAFGANPGGGTLSGTASAVVSGGVATFSNLSINKSANSYTLSATSTGLTSATSSTFNVAAATASQVGFTVQPGGGTGGVAWATQPKVAIQDVYGNTVTTSTAGVTLTIASGTSGAVLTCTSNPSAAVAGVATFAGCKIDKSGSYVLTGTSGALTSATSASFNVVVGPATKLVYTAQPTSVIAGASISPAVTVAVQDAGGNTVTSSGATVALAFGANPGGGTLSGTASAVVSGGVATFSNLSINKSANSYTLSATSTGLTSATSSTFNVAAATASQVGFTVQPGGGTGGVAWATQPKVAIQDVYGNTVTTSTAGVTLTIASGTSGAVLTCTSNPSAAVAGVATFAGCKIDLAGTYTLTATATGLTSTVSSSLSVAVGAAAKLGYAVQPNGGNAAVAWTSQPQVLIQDAGGNTVTSSSASVTLAITAGTGTSGAVMSCTTNPLPAVSGVATFAGCKINLIGTGYTLKATSGVLTLATSNAFNIS